MAGWMNVPWRITPPSSAHHSSEPHPHTYPENKRQDHFCKSASNARKVTVFYREVFQASNRFRQISRRGVYFFFGKQLVSQFCFSLKLIARFFQADKVCCMHVLTFKENTCFSSFSFCLITLLYFSWKINWITCIEMGMHKKRFWFLSRTSGGSKTEGSAV
jgi:hypothetical protein